MGGGQHHFRPRPFPTPLGGTATAHNVDTRAGRAPRSVARWVSTRPASTGPLGGVDSERPILSAQLQVLDAPDLGLELWPRALETRLRKSWKPEMPSGPLWPTGSWSKQAVEVSPRGLITMSAPPAGFNVGAIVNTVREALRIANEAVVARRRVIDTWQEGHDHLADPYKQALEGVQLAGQQLVLQVDICPAGELTLDEISVPEPVVRIQLSPNVLASAGLDETTLWRELPQMQLDEDHTISVRQEITPPRSRRRWREGWTEQLSSAVSRRIAVGAAATRRRRSKRNSCRSATG